MRYFKITLAFPPSLNGLFATNWQTKRRFPCKRYGQWLERTEHMKPHGFETITTPVSVDMAYGRPYKRRRDLANLEKAPNDLMVKWKVLEDDSQIHRLTMRWAEPNEVPSGFVQITICEL